MIERIEARVEAHEWRVGRRIVHAGKKHGATGAFDQYANGRGVNGALDEVAFPVHQHYAIRDSLSGFVEIKQPVWFIVFRY